jgi:hypothetical protein
VRRDGSSNLLAIIATAPAPLSAAWRMSRKSLMQGLAWIDDLTLRSSWGKLGNQHRSLSYQSTVSFKCALLFQRHKNTGARPDSTPTPV